MLNHGTVFKPSTSNCRGCVLLGLFVLSGCAQHDLGTPCPQALQGGEVAATLPTDEPGVYNEAAVVVQGTDLPCEQTYCIASGGSDGYCSAKCDGDASCPGGFVCAAVQRLGQFANVRFCTFKACSTHSDCGAQQCCSALPSSTDVLPKRVCRLREGSSC